MMGQCVQHTRFGKLTGKDLGDLKYQFLPHNDQRIRKIAREARGMKLWSLREYVYATVRRSQSTRQSFGCLNADQEELFPVPEKEGGWYRMVSGPASHGALV